MRDMVAQCDSNMSELQQLQVRPLPPPPPARAPPTASDGGGVSADEPRAEWVVQTRHADARWPEHPALQSHTHRVGMWQAPE